MKTIALLFTFSVFSTICGAQSIDKSTAKVEKEKGLYIFVDSSPLAPHDTLGELKSMNAWSAKYEAVKKTAINKAWKEYPEAEGIILLPGGAGMGSTYVIKFK